jgi:predicted transcriptional regulator
MTRHPLPRAQRTQTTVRIRDDLLRDLDGLAEERGITRSHLIEQALVAHVAQSVLDAAQKEAAS